MTIYADTVFAPIDIDHMLERVAGGNETEVYRSDDGRFAAKLKCELGGDQTTALASAREMRDAAEQYSACLGLRHSIPSHYLLARDNEGRVQVLVIQPFLTNARPLSSIDYGALEPRERRLLAAELRSIIRRAERFYRRHGSMPDLYGRTSTDSETRRRNRSLLQLPRRIWSFLVERTLLHSHNLLRTSEPDCPVVLVDYDFVRRSRLYRQIYYLLRIALFYRDRLAILLTLRG